MSWSTVVEAVDRAVVYGRARKDYSGVRLIGIDELSRRRGHIYHTNVYDLETRELIWSAEGRSKDTLKAFFAWLGEEGTAALEGICCDMWANYIDVVKEKAPQATLVFDKFHIVRHLLRAVNDVRKMEQRALKEADPELLKGTRYLFLKNPENLTDKQAPRLAEIMKMNLKVVRAYLLKELFKNLWTYKRKAWAKKFLDRWFWWATHSRLKSLRDFAWMLRKHEDGILAYFDCRIDNGLVEAMNNNAKAISHRARGSARKGRSRWRCFTAWEAWSYLRPRTNSHEDPVFLASDVEGTWCPSRCRVTCSKPTLEQLAGILLVVG